MMKRFMKFTIIELLVVVSIIAVLISMLLPALNTAKGKARATKCAGNMKQLGMAHIYYYNDYGYFRPTRAWSNAGITVTGQCMYHYMYVDCPCALGSYLNDSVGYVTTTWRSKFACPSVLNGFKLDGDYYYYTVGGNVYNKGLYKSVNYPSSLAYAGEVQIEGYDLCYTAQLTKNSTAYRHNGMNNILYYDSHVDPRKATELKALPSTDKFWLK